MKHIINFALVLIISISSLQAQEFKGLDASPLDLIEYPGDRGQSKWARILYSRPQLKGRAIESLVPEGKVWRLGANESTELTLFVPMKVGGTSLAAGMYTLYAIPQEGEMTIIVNKATHVWGAYSYDEKMDVARIRIPLEEGDESLEAFSMIFQEAGEGMMDLHLGWDYYRGKLRFSK